MFIQQGKISIPGHLFNRISGIVAVQAVNPRRFVIHIADSCFIGLGHTLGHLVAERFKSLPAANLSQSPLFIIGFCPLFAVLHGADHILHFFIPPGEAVKVFINGLLQLFRSFAVDRGNALFQFGKLQIGQAVA